MITNHSSATLLPAGHFHGNSEVGDVPKYDNYVLIAHSAAVIYSGTVIVSVSIRMLMLSMLSSGTMRHRSKQRQLERRFCGSNHECLCGRV